MQKHLAASAIFVTLAIVMTWPLAPRITHAVADPNDPFINIWILDWDHYATFHRPLTLFDANIFYPAHDTLALSENMYGIALLLMPFRLAGAGPVTAYNLAMLGGFAFSGFAAYLLGVRLTGSFIAGITAGVFHAFVPFRFTHLSHVQHVFAGWLPLLVVALLAYVDRPSWRTAGWFGIVFLMNGLTNVHWFLFGSFAIGVTALLFVVSGVRRWRALIVATCVAGALLVPFLIPYARVAKTMSRGWSETKSYSATWSDWLVSSSANRLYVSLRDPNVNPERRLFPGFLAIVCALAALPLARRYPRGVTLGVLWTAIGVLGSLGLNFAFHQFLFDAVPGFRGVRAPARWAEIAYVGMAMLIAVTIDFVAQRRRWLAAALPLLFLVELDAAPIRWYRAPVETPDVYRWLATQNVRALAELPMNTFESEYFYTFHATDHHKNIVNGVSGAVPPEFAKLSALSTSSRDEFLRELRRIGCDVLIEHKPDGDHAFRLTSGGPVPVAPGLTTGFFDRPPGLRGKSFFSAYAVSPYGIGGASLLFEDGKVRIPMFPIRDHRFAVELPHRPEGVPVETDVQVEVVDGRGARHRLQYYWLTWE